MEQSNLSSFLEGKIRAGQSFDDIQRQLVAVGWSDDQISSAYTAALVASGVPVPDAGSRAAAIQKKSSTVEIVINFFSFILLGIEATALGTLYFQVINKYFPDPLVSRYDISGGVSTEAMHYAMAALVVGFPLYYLSMRWWFRKFRTEEGKAESRLTKWLTYLVLLATAITIVGDLIAIVFRLLQGEITARFFLKALILLVIAGVIFGFYFLERQKIQYHRDISRTLFQYFGMAVSALIVIGIVLGFVAGGTPNTERMRTFDQQRADNLRELAGCVQNYGVSYKKIPNTLTELEKSSFSYCGALADPETGSPYQYRVVRAQAVEGEITTAEFELCANFATDSTVLTPRTSYYYNNDKWSEHGAGQSCDSEIVVLDDRRTLAPPIPVPFD